ncbi:MAG: hypothetical protein ACI4HM_09705 [Ruminococcus sp.]
MKKKLKTILFFITNPKLLLCLAIAWLITNGWAYILLGIGTFLKIKWMVAIASGYLAFLWLPVSPEKILTVIIAMVLLRLFFPNDAKTLAVIKNMYARTKSKFKNRKKKTIKSSGNETENIDDK